LLWRKRFKKIFKRGPSITGLYRGEKGLKENLKKCFKINERSESYPVNVVQAVQHLLYYLPFQDKVEVAIKSESELTRLQYSLGKYIQNEFNLDSNMSLIESCLPLSDHGVVNAEDASQIIIKEFWKQLKLAS
jgi:Domain of unknown function (DUF6794)